MDLVPIQNLIDEGKYKLALDKLDELEPDKIEVVTLRSLIYREMGNYDQSLSIIGKLFQNENFKLYNQSLEISKNYVAARNGRRRPKNSYSFRSDGKRSGRFPGGIPINYGSGSGLPAILFSIISQSILRILTPPLRIT